MFSEFVKVSLPVDNLAFVSSHTTACCSQSYDGWVVCQKVIFIFFAKQNKRKYKYKITLKIAWTIAKPKLPSSVYL